MEDRSCQLSKSFFRVVFPLIQASGKSLYHKQLVGPSGEEEGTRGEGLEDCQTSWSTLPEMASEHCLICQGGPGCFLDSIIAVVVACLNKPGSFDAPIVVVV
jgi:hypothetical protein